MRLLSATSLMLFAALACQGQSAADNHQAELHSYESCTFDDGLQIVSIEALPPGAQERTINTTQGTKTIHMLAGRRILFAYGVGGDDFVNAKPELLPDDTWATQKQNLLDQIAAMVTADHNTMPNTTLPRSMHGLEVHGFDTVQLRGNALGFYLLFDNERHIATTISFLNQDSLSRRFQTIEQYRSLRTRFLSAYTGCIAQNQSLQNPVKAQP